MPTIQFQISFSEVEQALSYLRALPTVQLLTVLPEENKAPSSVTPPTLTHEQLMALPEKERMRYYDDHGGPLSVMIANGYGLTEEDIDKWHRFQEEEDKILDSLSFEDAIKRICGK